MRGSDNRLARIAMRDVYQVFGVLSGLLELEMEHIDLREIGGVTGVAPDL